MQEAEDLEAEYKRAVADLGGKSAASGDMKDRAEKLRERARKLAEGVNSKAQQLQGQPEFGGHLCFYSFVTTRRKIKTLIY